MEEVVEVCDAFGSALGSCLVWALDQLPTHGRQGATDGAIRELTTDQKVGDSSSSGRVVEQEEVLVHPFVKGELACGSLRNRSEILYHLCHLPQAPRATDDEVLSFLESRSLSGRGIGYLDRHPPGIDIDPRHRAILDPGQTTRQGRRNARFTA